MPLRHRGGGNLHDSGGAFVAKHRDVWKGSEVLFSLV